MACSFSGASDLLGFLDNSSRFDSVTLGGSRGRVGLSLLADLELERARDVHFLLSGVVGVVDLSGVVGVGLRIVMLFILWKLQCKLVFHHEPSSLSTFSSV
jgi:hypothetical protein